MCELCSNQELDGPSCPHGPPIPVDNGDRIIMEICNLRITCFSHPVEWTMIVWDPDTEHLKVAVFMNQKVDVHPWLRRALKKHFAWEPKLTIAKDKLPGMMVDNYLWQCLEDMRRVWTDTVLASMAPDARRETILAECRATSERVKEWADTFLRKRYLDEDQEHEEAEYQVVRREHLWEHRAEPSVGYNRFNRMVGFFQRPQGDIPRRQGQELVQSFLDQWESKEVTRFLFSLFIRQINKDKLGFSYLHGPPSEMRIGPAGKTLDCSVLHPLEKRHGAVPLGRTCSCAYVCTRTFNSR
ncbi:ORF3 [Anguillid herpesvirus 1]|nr:ORF3 [Anguillid herpesvirus 1]UTN00387.1 ORF3 [Anguillid herpesvirus 1]